MGDSSSVEVDFVIAGIGVIPGAALAEMAEIQVDNGIVLDAFCRSSDPDVFAAGDCASFPRQGQRIRLESVQNAIDQAETTAVNMLGQEKEYDPVPWFWLDHYEVKLQIAGLNIGYDNVITRLGAKEGVSSVWYYNKEKFLAVDTFNDPAAFMVAKRLLAAKISPCRNQVSDPEVPVKSLMSTTGSPASRGSVSM